MPESELLPRAQPRSEDIAAVEESAEVAERRAILGGEAPSSPARSETSSSSVPTVVDAAPAPAAPPRRPSLWQLPFCSPNTTWLHVTNALVYFLAFCINVVVYSEAVWPGIRTADKEYGPIAAPASWAYYIRDLALFLWGLAVAAQNLVEHKGWKEGLLEAVGHSWQILWYADSIWLVLHVSGNTTGLVLAPLFCLSALLAAAGTQLRLAVEGRELHRRLQAEGFEGVPALGYLLFMAPTSLAAGWLLLLHCHSITVALRLFTGSEFASATAGCVAIMLSTGLALPLLLRFRDVLFGLSYTLSVGSVWATAFTGDQADYRPDQLFALMCAVVVGLITYCIATAPHSPSLPQPSARAVPMRPLAAS